MEVITTMATAFAFMSSSPFLSSCRTTYLKVRSWGRRVSFQKSTSSCSKKWPTVKVYVRPRKVNSINLTGTSRSVALRSNRAALLESGQQWRQHRLQCSPPPGSIQQAAPWSRQTGHRSPDVSRSAHGRFWQPRSAGARGRPESPLRTLFRRLYIRRVRNRNPVCRTWSTAFRHRRSATEIAWFPPHRVRRMSGFESTAAGRNSAVVMVNPWQYSLRLRMLAPLFVFSPGLSWVETCQALQGSAGVLVNAANLQAKQSGTSLPGHSNQDAQNKATAKIFR